MRSKQPFPQSTNRTLKCVLTARCLNHLWQTASLLADLLLRAVLSFGAALLLWVQLALA